MVDTDYLRKAKYKLFGDPPEEELNFGEQMNELGVPVERTGEKREAVSITGWLTARGKGARLDKGTISVAKTYIGIADEVNAKLIKPGQDRAKVALCVVEYEGRKALAMKPDCTL